MTVSRPFHLMAKPIGPLCNLRCEYCFYLSKEELFSKERRSDFVMKDEVLEAFIQQYIQAQPEGTQEVIFAWQGGEPALLPTSFYEQAVELQKRYARPGMRVRNAFQTNGTLITPERARWFAQNDFLLGVSVDGPEELHNRFRHDADGEGSFSSVMRGVEALVEAQCEFNTLTVVQSDNALHPQKVYDFLKSIGSRFMQFIPIVEREHRKPGERVTKADQQAWKSLLSHTGVSERTVSPQAWGYFMTGVFDSWVRHDIGEVFVSHFDMFFGLHQGYPASFCVHSETCGNAMAIEHSGDVYSCDHYVFPSHHLGNLMDQPLEDLVMSKKQVNFGLAKRDDLPQECQNCSYLFLCRGGCPKNRLLVGDGGALNWLCEGYKSIYAHTSPIFQAMGAAHRARRHASEFRSFFRIPQGSEVGRNDPCPCLSGKKFKNCHGALR
ncbi:MAG: anaerobic sulfatase maturase [Spirochaetales bacterium]|nr:anaerobic sulfatase maturase [Spirochaetales bacterium]